MQIGIMLEGQNGLNWDNWKAILDLVDNAGYQCLFRSDHFTNASGAVKDALELWTSLTYAAANTKNIEFGPLVTPITFRHPAMIAQYAASIDVLSAGRLILGMGTGWQDREHKAFGIHFPAIKERYERLTDGLEIASQLLNSDEPVTYAGKHFSLEEAQILMKNPNGTKILIGGNGPKKTLPLAAKYAVEWNAVYLNRADFKQRCELLDGYLENEGRKPEDVKRSLMIRVIYGKDDASVEKQLADIDSTKAELIERGIVVGTGSEIVEQLGQWKDSRCERIMLQWLDLEDLDGLESMAKEILPHFH